MTKNGYELTKEEHAWLIENAPLVSIDLIVRNSKNQILLLSPSVRGGVSASSRSLGRRGRVRG